MTFPTMGITMSHGKNGSIVRNSAGILLRVSYRKNARAIPIPSPSTPSSNSMVFSFHLDVAGRAHRTGPVVMLVQAPGYKLQVEDLSSIDVLSRSATLGRSARTSAARS